MRFSHKRTLAGMVVGLALLGASILGTAAPASAAPLASIVGHARYCSGNQLYVAVRNDSTAATHQLRIVHNSVTTYRTFSLAAAATSGSYTAGVTGAYAAYLYRWNGSAYAFVTSTSGTLTCAVSASIERSGRYGRIRLNNTGTAYASVYTYKLAPAPVATYLNGVSAGTATVTAWVYLGPVGTHYAFYERLYNATSSVSPAYFTGVS